MDWRDLIAWQQPRIRIITGPTAAGGFALASAIPTPKGTGYSVGDVLTLVGGTGTATATVTVTAVAGPSGVTAVTVATAGAYSVVPPDLVDTTVAPPGGFGCMLQATWTPSGPGGLIQVCEQDPHRVFMLIGMASLQTLCWLSIAPMNAPYQGFTIGSEDTVEQTHHEFWLDRHGALCQVPWFAWADQDAAVIAVITVTQDESPCDRKPKVVNRGRFVRGLWLPQCHQPDGGSRDDIDAHRASEHAPLRPDLEPDLTEPLLDLLRRARRDWQGDDPVPWHPG